MCVVTKRPRETQPQRRLEQLQLRDAAVLRLAVVADTHSAPHPRLLPLLTSLGPDAILHAGDIGELCVLEELASAGRVLAVRGNIDAQNVSLPDHLLLEVARGDALVARILMLHIGVYGPMLHANVARLAKEAKAGMVICGHSHVPFIGKSRGITVFNPGSAGPRRFALPIVFGLLELGASGMQLRHISCETGQEWQPPS